MACGPKPTSSYTNNPFKLETHLNHTLCLVLRKYGLEGVSLYFKFKTLNPSMDCMTQ